MRKIIWILILGSVGFSFGQGQQKYFPESHQNIIIGMHMNALVQLKGPNLEAGRSFRGTPQLTVYPKNDTSINYTQYLFTRDSILFEVIIDYKDYFDLAKYMRDFYGLPTIDEKEWLFKLDNGRELYIWEYLNRMCIADGATYN